jgi:Family of unknown function (DUF6655)
VKRPRLTPWRAFVLLLALLVVGCGTTKMTDTPRAATEMLLVSQAVDYAVAKIDFSPLNGQTVFLDVTALEKDVVDKGYLISLVRQQLLSHGALIQEERWRAVYVVEIRAGAVGTDRHSVMLGTPAVSLPSIVPGIPTSVPEIALMKKSDQRGIAKIGVFAYNRITGRAVWQSGTVEASSQLKDTWVFGAGPFTRGTIRQRTELAGEPLPEIPSVLTGEKAKKEPIPSAGKSGREQYFPNDTVAAPTPPLPAAMLGVMGGPILATHELVR